MHYSAYILQQMHIATYMLYSAYALQRVYMTEYMHGSAYAPGAHQVSFLARLANITRRALSGGAPECGRAHSAPPKSASHSWGVMPERRNSRCSSSRSGKASWIRAPWPREARSLWGVRALVLWRPGPGPDLSLLSALALDVAWEPSLQALEGLIRGGAKGGMDLTQRPVPPRRLKIFSPTRLVTTRKTSHVPTPDPALCHMQHGAHSGRAWSPKAPRTCEGDAHDVRR